MSIDENDDLTRYVGENFKFINKNETDFESFNALTDRINSTFESLEKERSLEVRKKRLVIWDDKTPPRWKGASLSQIEKNTAKRILGLLKEDSSGSFFLTGRAAKDKNFHAYAIMRKLIGAGKIAPSKIKIISEDTLLSYSQTGFEGRARIDELLSEEYDGFIIDNIGSKEFYDAKREIPVLEQLLLNIYNRSLPTVFISNISVEDFYGILGKGPADKMRDILDNRIIDLGSSEKRQSRESSPAKTSRKKIEDNFDG